MSDANDFRSWGESGQNMGDQVIYYRTPAKTARGEPHEQAGWIVWGDSISGTKLRDRLRRGFAPLFEYGVINSPENRVRFGNGQDDSWLTETGAQWKPILSHPNGPGEFPVDQLQTYRWYRPEACPVPTARFPQLSGSVREYRCPQCTRQFTDVEGVGGVSGLAKHLTIMHKWDRTSLNAYGDRTGIDFNKVDVVDVPIQQYEVQDEAPPPPPPVQVEVIGAAQPTTAFGCECGWVPKAESKSPKASLDMHKRLHCKLVRA